MDDWSALQARLPVERGYYFTKTATQPYTDVAYQQGDVLIFGSESQGLPPSLLAEHRERALRVPLREAARSLNPSNQGVRSAFGWAWATR